MSRKPNGMQITRRKVPNAPAKSSGNMPRSNIQMAEMTHANGRKSHVIVPNLIDDHLCSNGRPTKSEVKKTAHSMSDIMYSSQNNHAAMTETKHAQSSRQAASLASRQNLNRPSGFFEKAGLNESNITAGSVRTTSGTSRAKGLVARASAMPAQNDNVTSNVRNSMRTFGASPHLDIECCSDPTRRELFPCTK